MLNSIVDNIEQTGQRNIVYFFLIDFEQVIILLLLTVRSATSNVYLFCLRYKFYPKPRKTLGMREVLGYIVAPHETLGQTSEENGARLLGNWERMRHLQTFIHRVCPFKIVKRKIL